MFKKDKKRKNQQENSEPKTDVELAKMYKPYSSFIQIMNEWQPTATFLDGFKTLSVWWLVDSDKVKKYLRVSKLTFLKI